MADNNLGQLICSVCVEQLENSGEVRKKTVQRNTTLILGRNEFRDVILRIEIGKKPLVYRVQELNIFHKFAKEGKATIKLTKQKIQFLLSNCPPDKLLMFLRTMSTKVECQNIKGVVSERKRLFSELQKDFTEISPLTVKDVQTVHDARAKHVEHSEIFTPKGKSLKRKRPNVTNEKENICPKQSKMARIGGLNSGKLGLGGMQKVMNAPALTREQQKVLKVVLSGTSVFFTGSAGTGKSFLLKRIIGALAPQHTFATASTGVAACHIGGTTLHAFAGIGSGKASLEQCVELAMRPQVAQTWKRCKHLIIDEVSMVDGELFDKLEIVARMVRQNNDPFGGIQLILCGDFLQLPPVTRDNKKKKFAFQSGAWRRCVQRSMELTEVRRQSDPAFISILNNVRMGRCTKEVTQTLTATAYHKIDRDGILATRLCTHKEDVNQINDFRLNKLTGKSQAFVASDSDPGLLKSIDALCPVRARLQLKVGTQVMLAKNLDVQRGLVNGARGVVTGFESDATGYPKVKFLSGEEVALRPEKWVFKMSGGAYLSRRQLPLKLAWAISIHKSQGMSLDCVEMSLSKVFECGQAYVALSRARSLQGLRVLDFDSNCVRADGTVLKFYSKMGRILGLSEASANSQNVTQEVDHW